MLIQYLCLQGQIKKSQNAVAYCRNPVKFFDLLVEAADVSHLNKTGYLETALGGDKTYGQEMRSVLLSVCI